MKISNIIQQRYSTKSFDPTKKIAVADIEQLKAAMRFSPSSVNAQPWHFVIADDENGKARIAKAMENYPFNLEKVTKASHVVVFAARVYADEQYLNDVLTQEEKDGRFNDPDQKVMTDGGRRAFTAIHRFTAKDENQWHAKQVYLNMGFTLMAAAALGIDSVPMEGVDLAALDQEFGLNEKGYTAVAVVSFGYRANDDFNADLPKSRLAEEIIFTQA
ncbi:dihydropteridine reductase [Cricetibacter osteomyelitidis]|uniref:Dihydropteridine reductase n=1 Tax=Cricetibacter osteomyelitidis TaxID=1521931 RepID=A0A4R2SJS5_9PAST|nr:oxygen-insensitive NAD(P)H nitroreductase [Cricetibacter osteomyelitidis]TCP90089.1 dihydropteridine reductase [Cricetibacter osteomyelitidis]